ncbi:MAG: exosortase/archaeosortase family protein, partial [Paludibacter sp.]
MKKVTDLPRPVKAVALFAILLFASHFAWKLTVTGYDDDNRVTWLGTEITPPFAWASDRVTDHVMEMLPYMGAVPERLDGNVLAFSHGERLKVVWSCTGIKQGCLFFIIMLLYPGPWKQKLWYIPVGLLIVWIFNIFRITMIAFLFERNPSSFDLMHEHVFKYLFYIVLFLMWMLWEEKLAHVRTGKK